MSVIITLSPGLSPTSGREEKTNSKNLLTLHDKKGVYMKSDMLSNDTDVSSYLPLLSHHPLFSIFPESDLTELIRASTLCTYQKNEVLVKEDDLVDAVYFIVEGECEVRKHVISLTDEFVEQPIAVLRKEESIGLSSAGLYSPTGTRTATIVALTDVTALRLDIEIVRRFLNDHPNADTTFAAQLDTLLRTHFVKSVAPFATISNQHITQIVEHIEECFFPAAATIFEQGDEGDACYIIVKGKVEIVIRTHDGSLKTIAKLGKNSIFGEAALMTSDVRAATVRVLEPATLLKINKSLFNQITQQNTNAQEALMQLQLKRCRPVKADNIDVYTQKKPDGVEVTILRNAAIGKYVQLSEQGLFLWNLLDGESSMNEIALQFYLQFQVFNVEDIARQIVNLHKAGFAQLNIDEAVFTTPKQTSFWMRAFSNVRKILESKTTFGNADEWVTAVFNRVGWIFFTKPALLIGLLISVLGFISFINNFKPVIQLLAASPHKWGLLSLQSSLVALSIPLHELAHALTTKYYGRKIQCFGIGWFWFGPFAFCDTSDMWLSARKQRVMVDLAGIFLNITLAGLAGLCATLTLPDYPNLTIALILFALGSYLLVIGNLNTAFEFDGYYAMMDILDKPNLRTASVKWLSDLLFSEDVGRGKKRILVGLNWESIKHYRKEVIYWLFTFFYMFVISTAVPYIVFSYLLAGLLGTQNLFFAVLGTLFAFSLSSMSIYKDLRAEYRSKMIG